LVGGISLLIVLWVIRMIIKGSFSFSVGRFDLGILLIAVSYLASTFLATPNKMEAFLFPGITTFVLAGAVLYFLINQFDKKVKENAAIALFAGALLLSLSVLLTALGAFSKIPQLPAFMKDAAFNPMGGNVPSGIYMAVFFALSLMFVVKEKESVKKLFFGVAAAVILFALIMLIGSALPGKPQSPRFVSMQTSWEITVDALKRSPIFGAGPANYLTAFNLFRPVNYNQTDLWSIRFTTGSNYYFTMLTETGFFGLFALAVLLIATYKAFARDPKGDARKYSLLLLLVIFMFLPASPSLLVILFVLFALFSHSESKTVNLNVSGGEGSFISSRIPSIIVGIPFVAGVIAVLFFGSKVLAAEVTFKKSLDSLAKNNAKETYDLMAKSISQNPRVDRYHASFAQVNMAIATSLASKKDISEADRTTITQLVQQAISEGKSTVALNPSRSGNWEVLAQIYRSIMPFATGADQFAVQTYTQAVALDPTNPSLRIALGGVYYALGRYDNAIDSFKLAVLAKGDLANAHYNLAIAYREKKDYDNAIASMNNVLALVAKDSQDYTLAKGVLDELIKNRPAKTAEGTENLQPPQPVEESNVKPPIELPEDSTPPASP
jgi:tetratricopeptide (TPR) repeat protein